MARWARPHRFKPFAMTSMRLSSWRVTGDPFQVEVCYPGVGGDSCPCFPAGSGCNPLKCHPSAAKDPCLGASGAVVAE